MSTPETIGTLPTGEEVHRHTLSGAGRLQVLDLGGMAMSYWLDAEDPETEVLVGFDDLTEALAALDDAYFGAIVGRYANRLGESRFEIDGVQYTTTANENDTTLHGGAEGFSHRIWQATRVTQHSLELELTSPDGDQGFPGTVQARARYELLEDGFALALSATTDAPTPMCLTSHLYLNLAGGGTIDNHIVQVHGERIVPIDEASIPTGPPVPVEGTPFDLRQPTTIGERVRTPHEQVLLARGIDHSYDLHGEGLREVARVHDPLSGRSLSLVADAPALQVYTGNFLNGTLHCRGRLLRQGDAMALEPDVHPDSPNQLWADDAVLRPGEQWNSRIEWHFTA